MDWQKELLLHKYLDGELNEAEREEVEKLLQENAEIQKRYDQLVWLQKETRKFQKLFVPPSEVRERGVRSVMDRLSPQISTWSWKPLLKVAAVFLVCSLLYATQALFFGSPKRSPRTAPGPGKGESGPPPSSPFVAQAPDLLWEQGDENFFDMEEEIQEKLLASAEGLYSGPVSQKQNSDDAAGILSDITKEGEEEPSGKTFDLDNQISNILKNSDE